VFLPAGVRAGCCDDRCRTAQARAHPRHQLARRERLGHVIVGAQFQAEHAVHFIVAGGQEDHRQLRRRPGCTQPPADLETAQVGQAHVQHHHVDIAGLQPLQGLAAQQAVAGGIAFAAQRIEHGFGDGGFVLDHQDMGNRELSWRAA
jgi:hypothetical protein